MATAKTKGVKKTVSKKDSTVMMDSFENIAIDSANDTKVVKNDNKKFKLMLALRIIGILVVVGGVMTLWWWKTNTWPVVAMVNNKPVFRMEVDSELFRQGGKDTIESMITQKLIEDELKKSGVTADAAEVDKRMNEFKSTIPAGMDAETELKKQGSSLAEIKKLIEMQIMVNKIVASKVTVGTAEIDQYVKENKATLTGKTDADKRKQAEDALRQQKLQSETYTWVNGLNTGAKIWRLYK